MQLLIPLELIQDNPWQPRLSTDSAHVAVLADSISRDGLLQVPLGRVVDADGVPVAAAHLLTNLTAEVIALGGFRFQLAFGHSRLKAYRQLAETHGAFRSMPIELRTISDVAMATYGWSENAARKDLNPLEEAQAIAKRLKDFDWTHAQAAEYMGLERSVISNKLRLLKLPESAQEQIRAGELSQRQALALVALTELPDVLRTADDRVYNSPAAILRDAPKLTAETIRQRTDEMLQRLTHKLEHAPWTLDEELTGPDIVSPACRTCDQRLKQQNRCPLTACYNAKTGLVKARKLVEVAAALGIPGEGRPLDYHEYTTIWSPDIKKDVLANGCPRQQLRVTGGTAESPELTCVHGARKKCACSAAIEKAKQQHNAATTETKTAAAAVILQPVIDGLRAILPANRPVLLTILGRFAYDTHKVAEKKWTVDQIRDELVRLLIIREVYDAYYGEKQATTALPALLKAFELTVPAMMGADRRPAVPAAVIDTHAQALDVLDDSIGLVEQVPPTPEALPGVLRTLRERLNTAGWAIQHQAPTSPLIARLAYLQSRVDMLGQVAANVSANTTPAALEAA
jgi:ParB/RepB/Spo0J family partition protein